MNIEIMALRKMAKLSYRLSSPTICVMLVTLAISTATLMAQSQAPLSCHEVAIIGSVKAPGRFEIQARMRLVEALTKVGGPSERAGKVVRVVHTCNCLPCTQGEMTPPPSDEYNLPAALEGKEDANPYVMPGDIVIVSQVELVFVIGNVPSQKSLIYREGVTLTRAIAMVGGVSKSSDLVGIRIYRNSATRPRPNPLTFNLKAVLDSRSEDPVLQPSDIIEISDESGKFGLPMSPPLWDPLLMPRDGDPPLIQRRSSNC
jgi:SLBB domain